MKTTTIAFALALAAGSSMAGQTEMKGMAADEATEEVTFEITGDAAKGEKVFRKCKACHMVGEDAKHKTGPILTGIVGRVMGTAEEFEYSDVLAAQGEEGKIWTPEELDAFLTKPKEYLDGVKMVFAGLRKEKDRENVIAYLASFEAEETPAE